MSAQDEPDNLNRAGRADRSPDGAIQPFEAQLAGLSPRAVQLDRDRLMFLAGQASASPELGASAPRGWAWPAAFSAMSALAAGLLLTLVLRSQPHEVVKIVYVPVENVHTGNDAGVGGQSDRLSPSTVPAAGPLAAGPLMMGTAAAPPRHPYVELRDRVLAMDLSATELNGWPAEAARGEAAPSSSPAGYHDLLESLLHGG